MYASILLVTVGGFLITANVALPLIKKNISSFQNRKPVAVNQIVAAEPNNNESTLPEIKQEDEALKALIKEKLDSFPKDQKWSVFLYDLSEGGVVNINSDQIYSSASLYKLFLLEGLESKLPFDKWAKTRLPDRITVKDCVEAMLKTSDSACAENLGDYVGWDSIDETNAKSGFANSKVSSSQGRKTNASEAGELLIRMKKGQVLSDKARRFVFDALYQQSNTKGITLGCNGCRVADKLGEAGGIAHNAGVVTHGSHSYVLVVMSENGSFEQISEITKLVETNR